MELRDGDVVSGKVIELTARDGKTRYGCAYALQEGSVFSFDPHRRHAVLPWTGERIAIIGYTPGLFASLQRSDREVLRDLQFPLPLEEDEGEDIARVSIRTLSAVPIEKKGTLEEEPLKGGGWSEVIPTSDGDYLFKCDWSISKRQRSIEGNPTSSTTTGSDGHTHVAQEEWDDWEMKLVLEDDAASSTTATIVQRSHAQTAVRKAEVAYTEGIESLLGNLSAPLSIVHTVHPGEAAGCLERWIPAITKEATSLEHAVDKVLESDADVILDIQSGDAEVIPMKLVFTVKPPDADAKDFYKRKARIVFCGNLATHCPDDVFASTAPAEVVRAAIALATYFNWDLGMIDIVAAFLQTPLHAVKNAPRVYGKPPKVLIRSGICRPGELWRLTHAVYGLQESPRLWGAYRDEQLSKLQVVVNNRILALEQGKVESSWWKIVDQENGELKGILVVYVDDILLSGSTLVVQTLAEEIKKIWKTSPLQIVGDQEVRFLGIEIAKTVHGYSLSQRAYIEELLRIHETPDRRRDLIPVSKDIASFIVGDNEGPADDQEVRSAQRIAGELLWISQRTRPDVAYACSLVGSLATRAPRRAIEVGEKVLAYLQRTWGRSLIYEGRTPTLTSFVDASFAPDSTRSHTGWIIQLGGNVIAWRSSRQTSITLSTAEAELEAMTEGLVALQGIHAILVDIGAGFFKLQLQSDSTSALAIANGSCSWRTRHLRLKSAWIGELIQKGEVFFSHCCGDVQPADMLTKPLSSSRLRALSSLIGLVSEQELDGSDESSSRTPGSSTTTTPSPIPKVLIALLLLSQASTGESVRDDQMVVYGSGVSVDYSLVTWMVMCLMVLGCLVFWEALKWAAWFLYDRATPGAKSRRLRRLQKLRDATTEAIQNEIRQRAGNRLEQRALDAARAPSSQAEDPPRAPQRRQPIETNVSRSRPSVAEVQEEQLRMLTRLARGAKEYRDEGVQTSAFVPVQGPGTRVILRYVHEPPGEAFYVPDNECYHVYGDCHAFRHRGTREKVQRRRLCQYCLNRSADDPDKAPDYGRDLARAREYEELFNTTLTTSGQSSRVSQG